MYPKLLDMMNCIHNYYNKYFWLNQYT